MEEEVTFTTKKITLSTKIQLIKRASKFLLGNMNGIQCDTIETNSTVDAAVLVLILMQRMKQTVQKVRNNLLYKGMRI